MSSLSSSSSLAQVEASYADNASYQEDADVAKAKAFITACRFLIRLYPKAIGSGQQHTQLSPDLLRAEIASATEWLQANDNSSSAAPRVTRVSFEEFKEY